MDALHRRRWSPPPTTSARCGRHRKRINISFDEWNVWYQSRFAGEKNLEIEETPRLIEDVYSVTDAVVVGNLLISLLRHADRVKIGCLAQLVNVIAPIMTEPGGPAWRQASFHPFALTTRYGRGTVLQLGDHRADAHDGPARRGAAAGRGRGAGVEDGVVLFAVNRSAGTSPMALDVDLRAAARPDHGRPHVAIADDDPDAMNTAAATGPGAAAPPGRPEAGRRPHPGRPAAAVLEHDQAELSPYPSPD